ncbi:MAG: methyltransferase domain-containing protein [Anaerolineales bacterium]
MDLAHFRALCTPIGQQALAEAEQLAPQESSFLQHFQRLAQRYPQEIARAALETAILRARAQEKFPQHASAWYFTRAALEQASPAEVSRWRATRFAGYDFLLDAGCSIGSDTCALAETAPTLGMDIDPLRLAMCRENLRTAGLGGRADLLMTDLRRDFPLHGLPHHSGIFFDPARRSGQRRLFSVADYQPPLAVIRNWLPHFAGLGVKISPGVNLDELSGYDCEVEFISLDGDLKEACLWFGDCRRHRRQASLLPGGHTLTADPQAESVPPRLGEPGAFIYEPDPAVLRAGLVRTLAATLNAWQLDPEIAYLCADVRRETPFARCWQIEDWMPFQMKRLRAWLRERGVGQVTVKKRGSALTPEEVQRALKLKGDRRRVLFLTRLAGRPIVVVALEPA